jgi:hypothetical protein
VIRYSAIALIFLAAGSAQAAEKTLDKTFTVTSGGTLTVDADAASVEVSGGDTNQVTVHMRYRASDEELARTVLDAAQKDGGVLVTMKRQEKKNWFSWGSWNSDGDIRVTVPRNYTLNIRTGGGSIAARDTIGTVELNTSGGDIEAKNLKGNAKVHTSGGGILVDTLRGDIDAHTSGGDVRLLHIDGKIKGHTSGGSVRVSLVGANREISATTSGGDVEVTLPKGTTGNVEASTSGGDIKTDLPVTTTVFKEGRLDGSLNGGGAPIYIHTSGGSISLRAAD